MFKARSLPAQGYAQPRYDDRLPDGHGVLIIGAGSGASHSMSMLRGGGLEPNIPCLRRLSCVD